MRNGRHGHRRGGRSDPVRRGLPTFGLAGCAFEAGAIAGAVLLGAAITVVIDRTVLSGDDAGPAAERPVPDPRAATGPVTASAAVPPPTAVRVPGLRLSREVRRLMADRRPPGATAPPVVRLSRTSPRRDWAFGTSATPPPAHRTALPDTALFLARHTAAGWRVELSGTPGFAELLRLAPASVVPAAERPLLAEQAAAAPRRAAALMLPWREGQAWTLGAPGPPGEESLGFGERGGQVRAAAAGRIYRLCSSGPADGLIMVLHPGGPATRYYQLSRTTPLPDGSTVERGDYLGEVGVERPCGGGPAARPELRFGVLERGRPVPLDGLEIGGWTLRRTATRAWAERAGLRTGGGVPLLNHAAGGPPAAPEPEPGAGSDPPVPESPDPLTPMPAAAVRGGFANSGMLT